MQEFCQVNIKHKYFQSSFLELKLVQPYGVCIGMPFSPQLLGLLASFNQT